MPPLLSLVLLLLPALAACQTSRVQGFSVVDDQRESYILEVIPLFMTAAFLEAAPLSRTTYHENMILTHCIALLFFTGWASAHASERSFVLRRSRTERRTSETHGFPSRSDENSACSCPGRT